MVLGGVERAEHRLLAGHAGGVPQAARPRHRRRPPRAAHGAGSAARTPPGGGRFLRDFLEHCLRGTNHATGEKGTPLDFVAFHAKGAPTFVDGHVRMGIANQLRAIDAAFGIIASFPELKGKPIVIGESDPDGCAACSATVYPQNGYRNGTLYASYTAASFARKHDLAAEARRQPRRGADVGVRVRGPAVLRRLPRRWRPTASPCRC